jgi:hypothetical protein
MDVELESPEPVLDVNLKHYTQSREWRCPMR